MRLRAILCAIAFCLAPTAVAAQQFGGLCALDPACKRWADFITEYTGLLRYQRDHDGRIVRIGKVHAYRIQAALAADHGASVFDACDCHSQPMQTSTPPSSTPPRTT